MSSEQVESGLGSFIHSIIPDQFHVDPYRSEVTPNASLQRAPRSFHDYKDMFRAQEVAPEQEENAAPQVGAEVNENNGPDRNEAEVNENNEPGGNEAEEVITPVDEEGEAPSLERNVIHSFGNFIYDIYQSSSYGQPYSHNLQLNRMQYMQEYYRRMIQLLESSQRMEPATEETLRSLCIVVFSPLVDCRTSTYPSIGAPYAWRTTWGTACLPFSPVCYLLTCHV